MTLYLLSGIVIGILTGVIGTLLYVKVKAQSLMFFENLSRYDFAKTEQELVKTIAAMDWKLPFVHDLQETMKKNGYEVRPVKIFEICKPVHAEKILGKGEERIASGLMPCRIAVYEKPDGKVYVSRMNAALISGLMKGAIPAAMKKAAEETEEIIEKII